MPVSLEQLKQASDDISVEQALEQLTQETQRVQALLSELEKQGKGLAWTDKGWSVVDTPGINAAPGQVVSEQEQEKTHKRRLPAQTPITSSTQTKMPGGNGFRGLTQSFGPGVQHSVWNTQESTSMELTTPNNCLLSIRGDNDVERVALHQYITDGIGVEGLKHMTVLLHAYYAQTGGQERKDDAVISPRQVLELLGDTGNLDDKEKQRKVVNTILYLARTWIMSRETRYVRTRGGGSRAKEYTQYTPLIVLETLKPSEDGGLELPRELEFHLGKEFYDMLFGERMHYFMLPAAQIIGYHGQKQQQEICLAFYLCNYLTLNSGSYAVHFPTLLEGAGVRLSEDMAKGHDRTRDALRALYALEQLQKDGWIVRAPHADIDMALAANFYLAGQAAQSEDCAPETLERIKRAYGYIRGLEPLELKRKRRESLQSLLATLTNNAISFKAGSLLAGQADKLQKARKKARERSTRAAIAQAVKAHEERKEKQGETRK